MSLLTSEVPEGMVYLYRNPSWTIAGILPDIAQEAPFHKKMAHLTGWATRDESIT
jgi:hypothetical protein